MTRHDREPIPGLTQALATGRSFGRLVSEGLDIDRMIATETSIEVLEQALKAVRTTGDLRWSLLICRRLVAISGLPAHRLDLARSLVWAQNHVEADQVLAALAPGEAPAAARAVIDVQIALGLRDETRARRALDAIRASGGDGTTWRLRLIAGLMSWGQVAAARQEHRLMRDELGPSAALAQLDVRLTLVEEGPGPALQRLDGHAAVLPPGSEFYRALKLSLLNERGRHNEAVDLALLWLDEAPLSGSLYGPAMLAAQQCDRVLELARTLTEIDARYPGLEDLTELLCNHAIDQGDLQTAAILSERVRETSTWTWMIIRFGAACQNPKQADIPAFLAMLQADGIHFPGPRILFALFVYYYAADTAQLVRAQQIIADLIPGAMDDSGLLALHLRLLIALERDDEAQSFFDRLPAGLRQTAALAPFQLYFLAQTGRDAEAKAGWTRYLSDTAHMALNARSSFPEDIALRFDGQADDILVFVTVFNGMEYLDWFLAYYRKLGVGHFFFCDNGSTDGTFEHLLNQPDVSLFRNTGSFAASACGVFWANHLMRRFGVGHWCLHLDMDEALVFPGIDEGRSLRDLVNYMDANGHEAAAAGCMIDIYPDVLATDPDQNVFAASRFIDTDYVWMRNELPPYRFVKGGVRSRLTGRSLLMTKAPLVKMRADTAYIANNHQHTHLKLADVSVALLHYKFIGAIRDRVAEAVDRQEHFLGARFYRVLQASLRSNGPDNSLTSPSSVPYTGSRQLLGLGLIRSSKSWAPPV